MQDMKDTPFGRWLRANRKGLKLSQEGLGRLVGVDRTYISKLENGGIGTPDPVTREKFHKAFHTSEDELVELGILERREYPRPGGVSVEYIPSKVSIASDVGEREAVMILLDSMPDEAVQHLRQFLESVTGGQ